MAQCRDASQKFQAVLGKADLARRTGLEDYPEWTIQELGLDGFVCRCFICLFDKVNKADAASLDAGDVYSAVKVYGLSVAAKESYAEGKNMKAPLDQARCFVICDGNLTNPLFKASRSETIVTSCGKEFQDHRDP